MTRKSLTMFTIFLLLSCFFEIQTAMAYSTLSRSDEKVIYLTFDDGPSVMTDKVLDILKQNDVKATFFLIGNQIKGYEDMVKRIYTQGNSIGLHTYTHTYNKIYSSRKGFISEMLKSQSEISSIIGVKPTIIRFPSGSSKHLTKAFLEELHGYNFKVYDWNAVMSDGVNCNTSPDKLYREATKITIKDQPIILLMHCDYMHKNTCKALPGVIKFYKDNGYEFKTINDKTTEIYFPIKNNK
ncbi:polysaccharide deacetylase [Clostridium frigoris]|uniref:Polysaccharide deacetylase n=1 Tax=Clostridium frigoris TaxID=205327 RepID=A0ABS6BXJ5_9CLOT|nr:polysaccharide deacetylase family protein [Clostridium frigoris]MBU3161333.1 polysaccharide deacetylase [Clostridium frigoris]